MTPDVAMTRYHATGGVVYEIKLTATVTRYDSTKNYNDRPLAFSNPTRLTRNAEEFSNLSWMCLIGELVEKCVLSLTTRNDLSRRDGRNDLIHLKNSEPTHRTKSMEDSLPD
jgi:hypothetical protein